MLRVLKNPIYIGKRIDSNGIVNAVWSPIVSMEKWEKAQALLSKNLRTKSNNVSIGHAYSYLFSGMVHCKNCGVVLENGCGTGRGGIRYFYYRHPWRTRKENCSLKPYIPVTYFDDSLCEEIKQFFHDEELLSMICQEVSANAQQDKEAIHRQIKQMEAQSESARLERASLLSKIHLFNDMQIQELIVPKLDELSQREKTLREKIKEMESEMFGLELDILDPKKIMECSREVLAGFDAMKEDDKRKAIQILVEKIEIEPEDNIVLVIMAENEKMAQPSSKEVVRTICTWLPKCRSKRTLRAYKNKWLLKNVNHLLKK